MAKSEMKLANRAWRKATKNWGMNKKNHRHFCRENAYISVIENTPLCPILTQDDADDMVADELTYWGD